MVSIRKRGAVYGVIALMLCVAVYLNWSYVKTPDDLVVAQQADEEAQAGKNYGEAEQVDSLTTDGTDAETAAGTAPEEAAVVSKEDYFAQSRLSREKARDEAISILKETVESDKADEKAKNEASQKISALAENSVQEARVESLIKAKGYAEAVVFIGEDSVNVIVQPPQAGFEASDASKIKDIVVTETGAAADKIKIVEAA
ncbi:SpoIIIAH-like family protein [Intestinibacillus massiliensis]|uniref:SpoIIIAH-like family protein n=1 Tax=Intestinibacillus massiliensis TaxID=1871029 RepID=UPI000B3616C1|nr:SpoIIIAH-like family protein [Intestinibacillus massiliensis]MCB6364610.1 SpoIIIAH-like family protein [Intestinibacillus massiliensis]